MADSDFVFRVTEACMRSYAEQTWGRWDESKVRSAFTPATHQIIQYKGHDIGCLALEDSAADIVLDKLFILPAYQNRGIGTSILRHLIGEARAARKPLRLSVLVVNPARQLYERMGFAVTRSTPERHHMEWSETDDA